MKNKMTCTVASLLSSSLPSVKAMMTLAESPPVRENNKTDTRHETRVTSKPNTHVKQRNGQRGEGGGE